uniref:uncharacterized protein LOC117250994 n=1 Tax=Epinephelus lanceolatus TaxID=310571 RepID=UPI0014451454|nr:uncharacterized protein LOC117250994 [Epinephelus lanceolatus]
MSSSVWLNFFYYTQIVPAQRAIFIWIKKNIKSVIFCIRLTEGINICLARANLIFCVCVMVMSSGSTVVYLSRHMRCMVANGQPISGPQLSGQALRSAWELVRLYSGREQQTSGSEQLASAKQLKYNSLNKEDDTKA